MKFITAQLAQVMRAIEMREMSRFAHSLMVLAITLSMLGWSARANAWAGLEGPPFPHWGTIPVKYYMNKSSFPVNISEMAEERVIAGFQAWSAPHCTFFDTQLVGDLPDGTFTINDGKNVVVWINKPNPWPQELGAEDSVIGVTLPVWSSDGMGNLVLEDADIIFNNIGFCWYDFDPSNPEFTCSGGKPVDTLSILTHEQGHFLGLGHTNVSGATMEPAYLGGNDLASLEQDDIDGVCTLYPLGGVTTSTGAGDAHCDSCWQNAAQNECLTPAKSCTSPCLHFGDCLRECAQKDGDGYEACATQCTQQFNDGFIAYDAYIHCVCDACTNDCGMQCTGPSPCALIVPVAGSQKSPGDCPQPTFVGTGGCGCTITGQDKHLGMLASLVIIALAIRRRRRSR